MSNKKLGKILLVSGSIVAASALIAIGYRKAVAIAKSLEDEEEYGITEPKYFTPKRSKSSQTPTPTNMKNSETDADNNNE